MLGSPLCTESEPWNIFLFSLLPLSDVERCIFLCLANIPTVVCLAWIIDRRHEPPAACLFVQDSRVHRGGSGTHKERKGGTVRARMKQTGRREKEGKWWWKRAEDQNFRDMAKARRMDRSKWKTKKFWCLHDVALKTNLSLVSDKKKEGLPWYDNLTFANTLTDCSQPTGYLCCADVC